MKISDLELYLVEARRTAPHPPIRSLLVRITTDSSCEGWGETRTTWRSDELPARRELLLPSLAGHSVYDIEELHRLDCLQSPGLRCAVEMACWDTLTRGLGQPLCNVCGGMYRRRIPLAARLPAGAAEPVVSLSRVLTEQGFHCQMVTASGDAADDLDVTRAVCDAVGGRGEIRLDGANRFDRDTARDLCRELEPLGLKFVLDPLASADVNELASLRRQTGVPLAVSTGIAGPADVVAIARSDAAPYVVIDAEQVGGLSAARKCAVVAEAVNIAPLLGKCDTLGIATAAMLQLVAATPSFSNSNPCAYHELQEDVLSEGLEIVDGMVGVPQGPGLGVEVDRAKVERLQVT